MKLKKIPAVHLALALLCFGVFAASSIVANRPLSVLSLVLFGVYMLYICINKPKFILKYLIFVFAVVTNIIGCAISEFSAIYLGELRIFAGFVGSLPLLILSRWLFLIVLLLFDRAWGIDDKGLSFDYSLSKQSVRILNLTTGAMLLVLTVMLFMTISKPSALLMGVDRFDYAQLYGGNAFLGALASYMPYLVAIPLLACRYGNKWLGGLSVLFYAVILIWTGTKFGNLFAILCVGTWIYYDKIVALEHKKLMKLFVGILASLSIIAGFAIVVSATNSETLNANQYIAQRAAQQGQLWWRTYDLSGGQSHADEFAKEIEAIGNGKDTISQNVGSDYSIYKIMYYTSPQALVDNKLAQGACYTEAGYAAMYYYFGYFGPIFFSIVMALAIALVVNALLRASSKVRIIDLLLLVRLTVVLRGTLGMFFWDFVDLASILTYCYFILRFLLELPAKESYRARSVSLRYTR